MIFNQFLFRLSDLITVLANSQPDSQTDRLAGNKERGLKESLSRIPGKVGVSYFGRP